MRPDLSITGRLAIGFGIVLMLICGEAVVFMNRYSRVDTLEARQAESIAPAFELTRNLRTEILRRALALRSYALTGDQRFLNESEKAASTAESDLARLEHLNNAAAPDALAELSLLLHRYEDAATAFLTLVQKPTSNEELTNGERQLDLVRVALIGRLESLISTLNAQRDDTSRGIESARSEARESAFASGFLMLIAVGLTGAVTARSVRRPAAVLLQATRALRQGDFSPAIALVQAGPARRHADELRELADTFGRMADVLQKREQRLLAQAGLSAALAAGSDVEPLVEDALGRISSFVHADLAALFVRHEENGPLQRIGGFAAEGTPTELRLGEGVVGQAALSMTRLVVRDVPSDTAWTIQLGVGAVRPRTLLAAPIVFEKKLVGVLLLASIHDISDDALSFVDEATAQLAVSLRNMLANRRVRELAGELQERNEQLRTQNDELQEQAEEIQAQNEELQAQTEEIQVQNEELRSREDRLRTQNAELERQRNELAQLDRQKDEFLSIASHELRTPITTMKLNAHTIMRRSEGRIALSELLPAIRGLDVQAGRLSELITRMLDASRATMGRLEIRRRELDLAELVQTVAEQARMRTTQHTIRVEGADEGVRGEWDAGYLEQVLVNLLENAIRYSPDGGEILVSLGHNATEVMLSVTDHGIGIPEEVQGKLFRPYFRHDLAKQVTAAGFGLGLYVSRQIVVAHGGEISVASRAGEGTTFTVKLPFRRHTADSSVAVTA